MRLPTALGACLVALLGSVTIAQANHRRQLDDLAFSVLSDARDIRWGVRDDFTHSAQLRYLCRESDDVFATARNLQDAIFRGRTLPIICNNIDRVRTELCEFEELLERSALPRHTTHRPRHRSRGIAHLKVLQHAIHDPCQVMQARVAQLRQTLDAMHALAAGEPIVVPPPVLSDPPLPAIPGHPGPHLPSPLTTSPHRHRSQKSAQAITSFSLGGLRVTLK